MLSMALVLQHQVSYCIESNRPLTPKPYCDLTLPIRHFNLRHFSGGWAFAAFGEEGFEGCSFARDHRLDRSLAPVAHPAVEAQRAGAAHRPGAVANALDAAVDEEVKGFCHSHESSVVSLEQQALDIAENLGILLASLLLFTKHIVMLTYSTTHD